MYLNVNINNKVHLTTSFISIAELRQMQRNIIDKTADIITEGDIQVQRVTDEGTSQVSLIITEGDTQVQRVIDEGNASELSAWDSEAEALTSDSYANEAEDVEVKEYSSNNDGTFTFVSITNTFSSMHWATKAGLLSSGLTHQGVWDMSAGVYPTTRPPEGTGAALTNGDFFTITVGGTTPDLVVWKVADWAIVQPDLSFGRYPSIVDWSSVQNVPTNVSNALNRAGDTMTGPLIIEDSGDTSITLNQTDDLTSRYVKFLNNGAMDAFIGLMDTTFGNIFKFQNNREGFEFEPATGYIVTIKSNVSITAQPTDATHLVPKSYMDTANATQDTAIALNTAKIGVTTEVKSTTTEVGTGRINNMVSLTQAEYDALTPVATTLYVIVG